MRLDWHESGVAIIPQMISPEVVDALIDEVATEVLAIPRHGVRNADAYFSGIKHLSQDAGTLDIVSRYLKGTPRLVRAIFFDKAPGANWSVTWHQDKTVAVRHKIALEGWGPWSVKDGVHHVQPPLAVLNQMVTLRIHLDAADENNGCLKVIPGSHREGIVDSQEVANIRQHRDILSCVVGAGDAVVMRPHILHASSKSKNPGHRRVVHLEYSDYKLPEGLAWLNK